MISVWFLHAALPLLLLFIFLPREPCMKNVTIAAPSLCSLFLTLTPLPTHVHTFVWNLVGDIQPAMSPSSSPLFSFLRSFSPIEWSSSSPLSVTRVISLCYFIWLSNESNPSAFHCSEAQIMSAASPLLSHTPPSPHPLPPYPAVNGWRRANVCASMWSTRSCQVVCVSFASFWAANEFIVWNVISVALNVNVWPPTFALTP